jgi:hypothetical protein
MHFTLLGKQVLEIWVSIGTRGLLAGQGTLTCSKLWVMLLGQDLHMLLSNFTALNALSFLDPWSGIPFCR